MDAASSSGDVPDVDGELSDEIEVTKLPWYTFLGFLTKGESDRLMIREDGECPRFHQVAEILHG